MGQRMTEPLALEPLGGRASQAGFPGYGNDGPFGPDEGGRIGLTTLSGSTIAHKRENHRGKLGGGIAHIARVPYSFGASLARYFS